MRKMLLVIVLFAAGALGAAWFLPAKPDAPTRTPTRRDAEPAQTPVRFAITAAFVSEKGVDVYQDIVGFIQDRIGRPCELVNGLSYRTVDAMLESGAIDVAFVCGLPYVNKADRDNPSVKLLVAPIMTAPQYENQPKYYSYVIVNRDSKRDSFESLRGCKFAYNDELSNSGYNMPRSHLVSLGETQGFFGSIVRSGSHEASIRMVAAGEADASCVDSLVLDFDRTRDDPSALAVKIIATLGPAGIPPVVVSSKLDPELKASLARAFTTMHEDVKGRAILDRGLLQKFVSVSDSNYDDIRKMKSAAEHAAYLHIK